MDIIRFETREVSSKVWIQILCSVTHTSWLRSKNSTVHKCEWPAVRNSISPTPRENKSSWKHHVSQPEASRIFSTHTAGRRSSHTHQFFFSLWTTLTRTCSPPRAICSPPESRHTRVKLPRCPSLPRCRPAASRGQRSNRWAEQGDERTKHMVEITHTHTHTCDPAQSAHIKQDTSNICHTHSLGPTHTHTHPQHMASAATASLTHCYQVFHCCALLWCRCCWTSLIHVALHRADSLLAAPCFYLPPLTAGWFAFSCSVLLLYCTLLLIVIRAATISWLIGWQKNNNSDFFLFIFGKMLFWIMFLAPDTGWKSILFYSSLYFDLFINIFICCCSFVFLCALITLFHLISVCLSLYWSHPVLYVVLVLLSAFYCFCLSVCFSAQMKCKWKFFPNQFHYLWWHLWLKVLTAGLSLNLILAE